MKRINIINAAHIADVWWSNANQDATDGEIEKLKFKRRSRGKPFTSHSTTLKPENQTEWPLYSVLDTIYMNLH